MTEAGAPVSRYAVTCPTCDTSFRPRQFVWGRNAGFHCPVCGEALKYARGQGNGSAILFYILMMVMGSCAYFIGYRGLVLILITIFGSLLLLAIGASLCYHIWPPKVQLLLRSGDTGLRLGPVPRRREDQGTSKNRNGS
jgi:hypothetical protein